jgi:hypothetical protein
MADREEPLYYSDYLQLDRLLSAQTLERAGLPTTSSCS